MLVQRYTEEKNNVALEARARRAAKRVGLRAIKSRARIRTMNDRGGFMLNDPHRNTPVAGERFDLEPEDVIAICDRQLADENC